MKKELEKKFDGEFGDVHCYGCECQEPLQELGKELKAFIHEAITDTLREVIGTEITLGYDPSDFVKGEEFYQRIIIGKAEELGYDL